MMYDYQNVLNLLLDYMVIVIYKYFKRRDLVLLISVIVGSTFMKFFRIFFGPNLDPKRVDLRCSSSNFLRLILVDIINSVLVYHLAKLVI